MEKEYFEDYRVGETFVSPARTVTESDIHAYAALTGDWHPLHTDVQYAQNSNFGERIAHGMLTLSIGLALPFRLGLHVITPKSFIAFYGMESVKFTAPCTIGDTIRTQVEVVELIEKDEARGIVVYEYKTMNQKEETVVTFIARLLSGRKPVT
ncbi:MAG: dehydratase [Desulfatitalea sp.]|nr:MaoC family dehydratase N-terminal domain-containing protein [Desulfatitalea sp.]NNK02539.1 dehydratase [Desulfatitalea sp.]